MKSASPLFCAATEAIDVTQLQWYKKRTDDPSNERQAFLGYVAGPDVTTQPAGPKQVPHDFAMRLNFDPLYSALDIVEIATETKRSAEKVSLMAK